jgi:hypothetical protein
MLARIFFALARTVVAYERIPQGFEHLATVFVFEFEHLRPKVERVSQGRDPDKCDPGPC